MNVIYDISVLGLNFRSAYGRAGVFRVVEALACALASSGQCDLAFSASYSLQALRGALDYLPTNPCLARVPLPHSYATTRLQRAYGSGRRRAIEQKWEEVSVQASDRPGIRQVLVERLERPLRTMKRLAEGRHPAVDPASLAGADIFHSPALAIPRQVRKAPHVQRFLTVHDLVPVLHPELFPASGTRHIGEALRSLGPDDWATCVSQATKRDLCDYLKLDPAHALVVYWAASPELFYQCTEPERIRAARQRYGIPDAPYLLSLNTIEPRKNMEHAIRSFRRLVREQGIRDLYFVLVGAKGWNYDRIMDAISEDGEVRKRIVLAGYVPDGDLAPLYSGALAFVYPSLYEGFGLPPLEAMQCGTPVITSNTSSLPEVVGDAGIMVSPTDSDALCEAILQVYNDPALREAMSARSLEQASRFSWERCAKETIAAYITALSAEHR